MTHVEDALASVTPLLSPLCNLLALRADGMAKHLVARLQAALADVTRAALEPTVRQRVEKAHARCVGPLVRRA